MKITVLVDNNTLIDQYYLGEPGLSICIEDGDDRVFLDTGYSDVMAKNAVSLGIDLLAPATIVISHSHNDHTGGLHYLSVAGLLANKTVVAHPLAFERRIEDGAEFGSPYTKQDLANRCLLDLSSEPKQIGEHIWFLGQIPQSVDFEERQPMGFIETATGLEPDYVLDDTALVYQGDTGLFIVTGCSHSGICNIVEHAKRITGDTRIIGIIGGFHIFEQNERLEKTISYLEEQKVGALYPCHCVSLAAKCALARTLNVREVGVSTRISVA